MAALAVKADKKDKKADKKDKKKDKKNDKQKVEKGSNNNNKSDATTFKGTSHNDELRESSNKALARNMFKTAWFTAKDKNE